VIPAAYYRARRARHRAAGLCTRCKARALTGYRWCPRHARRLARGFVLQQAVKRWFGGVLRAA
jgi:hypothetical protein